MDSRGVTVSLREKIAEIGRLLEWMENTGRAHPIDFELILNKTRELYELEVFFASELLSPTKKPAGSPVRDYSPPPAISGSIIEETPAKPKLSIKDEPAVQNEPAIEEKPAVKEEKMPTASSNPAPTIDFIFSEPDPVSPDIPERPTGEDRLNEALGKQKAVHDIASVLTETPVNDIWSAIAINDRFLFTRELFMNDSEAFKTTVTLLNSLPSWDASARYMSDHFDWDRNHPVVKEFQTIVRRRFLK